MHHQETGKDEIFVGNTSAGGVPRHLAELKTTRIGEQAYDIHGKKLSPDYMRPLFIDRSEMDKYDRIMCARLRA